MSNVGLVRRWMFLIVLVALGIRLGPVIWQEGLRALLGYDDTVYFSGAQHLVAGDTPYRDFLFLQPPGIMVLLAPFAELSHLVTDSWSFAAAKLFFVAIGVANTVLVARLLRPFGLVAMVAGAGLYAVWSGPAFVERTTFLEPLLNLSLLLVLCLFSRDGLSLPRMALTGALLGSAAAIKLWAGPEVLAIAGWLLLVRGWRAAGAWLGGASAALLLWIGPFFALAPSQMYDQVILDQLQRPEGVELATRLRYFVGLDGLPQISQRLPEWALFAAATLVTAAIVVAVWRADNLVRLWALLLTVQVAELLASPVYFSSYTAFAAPTLCLLVGFTVARVGTALRAPLPRAAFASGFILLLALLAISSVRLAAQQSFPNKAASRFASLHRCVWAGDPATLILANANLRQIDAGCEQWVDPYGQVLDLLRNSERRAVFASAPRLAAYQAEVRSQLRHSGAALIYGAPSQQGWAKLQGWDRGTARLFRNRFRPDRREGELVFWVEHQARARWSTPQAKEPDAH
jgi:alpha-1,2-mannosyltransferase